MTFAPYWWALPLAILVVGLALSWLIESNAPGQSENPLPAFVLMLTIIAALGAFLGTVL